MKHSLLILLFALIIGSDEKALAQCQPIIKIDGVATVINPNDVFGGTNFPFWLKEGQTLAIGTNISSISAIEFSISGTALEFSQVLNITSTTGASVPSAKVWKVESAIRAANVFSSNITKYTIPGTYTFTVPTGIEQVFIEVWGGGGAGGSTATISTSGASGAGGGGYGNQCFIVPSGSNLSVTVGNGGTAVSSSAGNPGTASSVTGTNVNISATGGNGGATGGAGSVGGTGGSSTASFRYSGQTGFAGGGSLTGGGAGGQCGYSGVDIGNGGPSVTGNSAGSSGAFPGGGGGGATNSGSAAPRNGGTGGNGQVSITY